METSPLIVILRIIALMLLVLANGFFVAAEFSLVSVRRTRITELVANGNRAARWVQKAIADPDSVIAATQLGITLSSLGLGWIGEPVLAQLFEPLTSLLPESVQSGASHGLSAGLAFAVITFLHVVIGELAPKSIALQNPERTSLMIAQPTIWTEWVFKPFIWVLNGAGNALLRLIGVQPAAGHEMVHSVAELKMLVRASAEGGLFGFREQEMVHAVFDFRNTLVRQVMVPRTEMVAISSDLRTKELIAVFVENPYTKVPVYAGDLDHIVGVIYLKDVLRETNGENKGDGTTADLMRDAIFVPEAARVSTLLELFRTSRQHIAIVLDEYGGTAGVVTLEDLVEEIVGEVGEPFDTEAEIQPLPDGSSRVDGLTLIEEINEHFGLSLHDAHYDTIAGYIIGRLGRLAQVGDAVVAEGMRFRVISVDGLRIERVSLTPLTPTESPEDPSPPSD
ncbi:MAG: hemolysin family protein [Anaerolineales bacterium]|jgi:CBS domain containing-hemolysin-like protein